MNLVHLPGGRRSLASVAERPIRLLLSFLAVATLLFVSPACGPTAADSAPPSTSTTAAPAPTSSTTAPPHELLAEEVGTLAARSSSDLPVFDQPGAAEPELVLPARNQLGSPLVLLVLDMGQGPGGPWLQVLVPGRPNGRTAWVPADSVTLNEVDHVIEVDLESRRLRVTADGEEVLTTSVAVGEPRTPPRSDGSP